MITRFAKGVFTDSYKKTLAVDFLEKRCSLGPAEEEITFLLWDTAGQEEYDAITRGRQVFEAISRVRQVFSKKIKISGGAHVGRNVRGVDRDPREHNKYCPTSNYSESLSSRTSGKNSPISHNSFFPYPRHANGN